MPLGAVRSVFVLVMFESLSLPHARYILSYWLLLSYYLALRVALLRRNEMVSLGRLLTSHRKTGSAELNHQASWRMEAQNQGSLPMWLLDEHSSMMT